MKTSLTPYVRIALMAAALAACGTGGSGHDGGTVSCGQAQGEAVAANCDAVQITTDGQGCRCTLGFYWNGSQCAASGGCTCTGNCDKLYPDMAACEAAYTQCSASGGDAGAGD